ncbi:Na+/H+ antiporter NhaA [Microlunatus flavus]|uniref:Na+/H+ antiporter NhaA n=1 Tax=Microlunatus flavus TaxID=1036181 RepID=UPI00147AEF41|nr:Na+/H+ antiporter NhaA [Microlunatus flavus]
MGEVSTGAFSGRTAWVRSIPGAVLGFLGTESGSARILLGATVVALLWANLGAGSYEAFWETPLGFSLGSAELSLTLHEWLNSGLMTFFFFVVGLEARREFDLGELRERARVTLPLLAGIGGMAVPVAVYLLLNAGQESVVGWGTAMSTDTAFALGLLAMVARGLPERVRVFLLTVAVVDDFVALVVITLAYSGAVRVAPLLVAVGVFAVVVVVRFLRIRRAWVYLLLGVVAWVPLQASGVEPVVLGLALGLLTTAYVPDRDDLERATDLVRLFREQPTSQLARSAQVGVARALSPNELLQQRFDPWAGYVIVPLFALANAGVTLSPGLLAGAVTSPITLGILLGYVLGKPLGMVGTAWLVSRLSRGRLPLPVGWAGLLGTGSIAGIGFTVALLVAGLAFTGSDLAEAKLGVLAAAVVSTALSATVFKVTGRLSPARRTRALLGSTETLVDLTVPVDPGVDHVRGPERAVVTLVEYGDFECPYCGQAEPVVRDLIASVGDLRYVFRHLPLTDVHPHAQLSAEAAEAAARQDAFWGMHDLLMDHQAALRPADLHRYAADLGLDVDRFADDLRQHVGADRVARDVASAADSGVSGTPTFFVNGRRQYGAYDLETLTTAVVQAGAVRLPVA